MESAVIESAWYGNSGYDAKHILSTLLVPALFICGAAGADDSVLPEEMEEYPALIKESSCQFNEVRGAGRLVCRERPEEFVAILHSWWREALGYPSP
ncbi:hypothetical protein BDR03DRAFT_957037 [Suillus americanus]|nr:hypothetical protein BDR03DRAFT_957037 [Suillus americanus]